MTQHTYVEMSQLSDDDENLVVMTTGQAVQPDQVTRSDIRLWLCYYQHSALREKERQTDRDRV